MRELLSSDILPLIINYLRENGYNKACKSLEKKVGDTEANKFSQTPLAQICEFYISNNKKLLKLFKDEPEVTLSKRKVSESQSTDEVQKKRKISEAVSEKSQASDISKKKKKPRNHSQSKKKNATLQDKVDVQLKLSNQKEESSDDDVPTPKRKSSQTKKLELSDDETPTPKRKSSLVKQNEGQKKKKEDQYNHNNVPFSKADYTRYEQLDDKLKDNTFEAKQKFGAGDRFGQIGHERLIVQRGQGFKKEKQKLKAKMFSGENLINIHAINSIKLS